MLSGRIKKIRHPLLGKNERTKEVIKNAFVSLIMRAANIFASLLVIPLTMNYVNPTQYGIWITISGIIGWILFFDLGLGNGFRNRFAAAKANGNILLARKYVSTTYFAITIIVSVVFILALILNLFMDWSSVLNVSQTYKRELQKVFIIVTTFTCLNMIANIFSSLLAADQRIRIASIINAIGQYTSLLAIFILTKVSNGSLSNLALYYSGIPALIMAISSIYMFYYTSYRSFRPSIKLVKIGLVRDILTLGGQFFIIYLCMIAIFQVINIVISREIGPTSVTQYNICNRYFNIIYIITNIILTPFWSAFTDAYARNDFPWMKRMVSKLEHYWLFSLLLGGIMLFLSDYVFSFWIGNTIKIPHSLSIAMFILISSQCLGSTYMHLINGIGTLKIQMLVYSFFALISWPLLTYLAKEYGLLAIVVIPFLVYLSQAILGKIQLKKLLSGNATGIWGK